MYSRTRAIRVLLRFAALALQLDGMPLTTTILIVTVKLMAGGRDSLAWDFR